MGDKPSLKIIIVEKHQLDPIGAHHGIQFLDNPTHASHLKRCIIQAFQRCWLTFKQKDTLNLVPALRTNECFNVWQLNKLNSPNCGILFVRNHYLSSSLARLIAVAVLFPAYAASFCRSRLHPGDLIIQARVHLAAGQSRVPPTEGSNNEQQNLSWDIHLPIFGNFWVVMTGPHLGGRRTTGDLSSTTWL